MQQLADFGIAVRKKMLSQLPEMMQRPIFKCDSKYEI